MTLSTRVFTMAVLGILRALALPARGSAVTQGLYLCDIASGVFVDLLKMILVPLVFTSIAVGVAQLRAHAQIHRVWVSVH